MKQYGEIKLLIADLKDLPADHVKMFVRSYLFTLLPVFLAALLYTLFSHWLLLILIFFVNGFVQNALGILMHEGAHYFFHKNKITNDLLADWLVCLPIMNTVAGYRHDHFEHHRESGKRADPYWELYAPITKKKLWTVILLDIFLLTSILKFSARYFGKNKLNPEGAHSRDIAVLLRLFIVQSLIFLF